jgi:tRNA A-37 threonylcarbamoyl transferase component Bud32
VRDIGIIRYFKRSAEGYLNVIELRYDEKKGKYIRKRFYNGFLANCYSNFITVVEAIPHGLLPGSGKSRKRTEVKRYKEFNKRGFPAPRLLEDGEDYIDIEYVEMVELSRVLRDINESKQKKLELIRMAAAGMRKIHDAGFSLGDVNVHNIGYTPEGKIVFFDFEHRLIKESREKDYSTFAGSAAYEVPNASDVRDVLKSIAQGYGEDLTQKISIVPYTYLVFLAESKFGSLHELIKAIRYGLKN